MKKNSYLCFLIFLLGCQSPDEKVLDDFKKIDTSITKSSTSIEESNKELVKINDSTSFNEINMAAKSLVHFIDDLKIKLNNYENKNNNIKKEEDFTPGNLIMIKQGNSDKLFAKIEQFQELCISKIKLDSAQTKINGLFAEFRQNKKIQEHFFENMPYTAVITILNKFNNDVRNAESIVYQNLISNGL